ncbi:MAG: flagellar protein [Dehalococcoidia bacterium]|nr:flagellar protein [Dehalococcoidia bacterium]
MVDPLYGLRPGGIEAGAYPAPASPRTGTGGDSFGAVLDRVDGTSLQFSQHALRRIEQRGLQMDEGRMQRLEAAVQRAEGKGSRDSLILLDELALVVSVRNHTVVTAMDEGSRKEHVFTNIDSVVIAD